MKTIHFFRAILAALIIISMQSTLFAQLSGTYTIGPGGAGVDSFPTFKAATDTLTSQGVSGPVIFSVKNGTYIEQFKLSSISGASAVNNITFESFSGDSTGVTLFFSSTLPADNYVVQLDSADYITFRKMTISNGGASYSRVFHFLGQANLNTIENCRLIGVNTVSTSNNQAIIYSNGTKDENNVFQNSLFVNGSFGIYFGGGGAATLSAGNKVINNQFADAYYTSIYMDFQDANMVKSNIISMNTYSSAIGIWLEYCDKNMEVTKNKIDLAVGRYGINLFNCDGNIAQTALIANNFVHTGGTSLSYGIKLNTCTYQEVFHNSVHVTSTNVSGRAFHNDNGTNLDVKNNIFANFGGGYAYVNTSLTAIATSDYNNYFGVGNFLAYWGSGDVEDLAILKATNGKDVNSISVNPVFLSNSDLHTTNFRLNGIADATTGITTDIDGEARSGSPDIGADEFTGAGTALSGTYTIGGASPNFATFAAAIDSLNKVGISATVTFNARAGSYTEQVEVFPVSGASASATVTFQAENGDSSSVDLNFSPTSGKPYVFNYKGTDYVNLKKMTVSATGSGSSIAVLLSGNSRYDTIMNCAINSVNIGFDGAIYGFSYHNNIVISNNAVNNSYYGIYLSGITTTNFSKGIEVRNNSFSGQSNASIYLKDQLASVVSGNIINTAGGSSTRIIYLSNCDENITVTKNKITPSSGSNGAIYLTGCNGTVSKKGLIANNFVDVGGTSTAYGIYTNASDYQNIYHNSVRITSTYTSIGNSIAYYNTGGSNLDVLNNIFSNFGVGYAYYTNSTTAATGSDYNNLYSSGSFLGYWVANATDLADFQSKSGKEANSVSVNPVFVSAGDMHTLSSFLDSAATLLATVTDDIDGEVRNATNPDIGADEFTPSPSMFPLSGVYTIGGSAPDYATFNTAVTDLTQRGVQGWVRFDVRAGAYIEHISIEEIAGATGSDSVTFQSESGDSTSVILTYNAGSAADDYVVKLIGADYITFKNMTFAATNNTNSRVFSLNGNVKNINIFNNIIASTNLSTSSVIHSFDNITNNINISRNIISEGKWSIYLNGDNSIFSTGTKIYDNIISGASENGIYLEDQDAPYLVGNDVDFRGASAWTYAIYLVDCDNAIRVLKNKVLSDISYGGIYLLSCNGTSVFKGLIANNFSYSGGSGTSNAYGLYLNACDYQNIYHNNMLVTSTSTTTGHAFYTNLGSNLDVKNNIFANTGGGYAYNIVTTAAITGSDYNDLYATGTNLAKWGGVNQSNLASLQTASGMDNNSKSVNPLYYSNTDLHILQKDLNQAGTPLPSVINDIDGEPRDLAKPDIGADEFFCETPTFSAVISAPCLGDSTTFKELSAKVANGSTYYWDFNGDGTVDDSTTTAGKVFAYLFTSGGSKTAKLIISQIAGCVDTGAFIPKVNAFPVLSLTSDGVYCDTKNGAASVTATGGITPYTYKWSTGSNDSTVTGLDIGKYVVAVSDKNKCTSVDTLNIGESFKVYVSEVNSSTCGNADGAAVVDSVTGGVAPYKYIWSDGDTATTDATMKSGIHYIKIIDANGCVTFGTVAISDGSSVSAALLSPIVNNDCYGDKKGSINIFTAGGTSPYTYQWSNGKTTEDIDSLTRGIYELIIQDAAGCVITKSYTVTGPDAIEINVVTNDAGCGAADGVGYIFVTGGVKPYLYNWSSGGTDAVEGNLAAGIYTVTVTDAKSCNKISPVAINNSGGPTVLVGLTTHVDCNNLTQGEINITTLGGTIPYTFLWDDPASQSTSTATGLSKGSYSVTITDGANCKAGTTVEIADIVPTAPEICLVTVDSATGKNLIVFDKPITTTISHYNIYKESSMSGVYMFLGKVYYDSLHQFVDTLADPRQRSWRYKMSAVDKCGKESELGLIHKTSHLTVNLGLNGVINLIWDDYKGFTFSSYIVFRGTNPDSMKMLTVLPSSNHSYTDPTPPGGQVYYQVGALHPLGGCTANKVKSYSSSKSNTSNAVAPQDLTASTTVIDAQTGVCNGQATATPSGGASPFIYSWDDPQSQTTQTATGLCGNTSYKVTITDANSKTATASATVAEGNSIAENDNISNLSIYPNPTNGMLVVEASLNTKDKVSVRMFNIHGAIVKEEISMEGESIHFMFDLTGLSSGIYHLQMITKGQVVNKKVVITK